MSLPTSEGRKLPRLLPASDTAGGLRVTNPPERRTNVAAACEACRRRKTKCSAKRPRCSECIRRSTDCHYSTGVDETHSQTLKRKYEELLSERKLASQYRNVFDLIRSMHLPEAFRLFERIRAGNSVQMLLQDIDGENRPSPRRWPQGVKTDYERFYHLLQTASEEDAERMLRLLKSEPNVATVLQRIQDADLLLQLHVKPEYRRTYEFPFRKQWPDFLRQLDNTYLQARLYDPNCPSGASTTSTPSCFDMPYSAASLAEPGFSDIRISKWTTVVADESLLTQLLEGYFLHGYPFFHFFHKDLFLADIRTGQTRFCSSLLVNALLAAGSHYLPTILGRNEPWNTTSLCYRFFAEARRLWELEMGGSTLTNLQAALVMNTVYNMDGLDEIGHIYMVQAAKIAHNMHLFSPLPATEWTDMDVARLFTAWGFFQWQATVCFHYYKPPLFEKPPGTELPDPRENASFYSEVYINYPLCKRPYPIHFSFIFFHTMRLCVILNEIAQTRFGGLDKSNLSFQQAIHYYHRLMQWLQDLPPCLAPQNIVLPSHLQLHLHFRYVVTLLFGPSVSSDLRDASVAIEPTHTQTTVQKIMQTSKAGFETVARLYYVRHSFSTYAPVMLQFLSVLGFEYAGAMESVQPPFRSAEESRSSLLLALHGLSEQAQSSFLSNTVFHLLFDTLPTETASSANAHLTLRAAEVDSQTKADYVRAAFPVNMVSINADAEERRLNNLLQRLHVSNQDKHL
ncbi:hypothetical protein LY78DRAFT_423597 [Colletotrichum sublineola]|nr:hypothetical protein LY78DRAFT_423597 [Colletotrichum sublineola]